MLHKKTNLPYTNDESVVAATLWLMTRYQQTRCKRIAKLIEQHLVLIAEHSDSTTLAKTCNKLRMDWCATYSEFRSPTNSH